ncbi:IS4 family transposase [Myroides sp. M-43]|uniref:IS4 family transposase n=1 Tax=Myroides oncorhynchi TaxID=2893756 RepID=UPI001E41694D|nr:IS4 family transposase [Myroides oncorhynchi]MCC9043994.1 IS4 family transposase [Myroides oncorhynchi]
MPLETNNSLDYKSTELLTILKGGFKDKLNLARISFISLFIVALCKVKSVNFTNISIAFDNSVKAESNCRRIQRFVYDAKLTSELVAKFIFAILPKQDKYTLVIDRTNWKFGNQNINILMLGVCYKNVAFPLIFKMLDKKGNSNTNERKELINDFIEWFGKDCIECLLADREFIGERWIEYLNNERIRYYIRIRNNFKVYLPHKQEDKYAYHLFYNLKVGEFRAYEKIVYLHGQLCYLSATKIMTDGKTDYCIIVSFNKPENASEKYKERWQIETLFRAMKSSGFNIEDTHLKCMKKLEQLIMLVMLALVWCYKIGDYIDTYIKPISFKKHSNRSISVVKLGLDYLARLFHSKVNQLNINVFCFLSCT